MTTSTELFQRTVQDELVGGFLSPEPEPEAPEDEEELVEEVLEVPTDKDVGVN
jgi:hypothetical protein